MTNSSEAFKVAYGVAKEYEQLYNELAQESTTKITKEIYWARADAARDIAHGISRRGRRKIIRVEVEDQGEYPWAVPPGGYILEVPAGYPDDGYSASDLACDDQIKRLYQKEE